jgi:hypothetical protein
MTRHCRLRFPLPILLFAAGLARAGTEPLVTDWETSPTALAGRATEVVLQDGTRLEGRWLAVAPDSFTFLVERSSRPRLHSRGQGIFARVDLKEMYEVGHRVRGRVWGTVLGYVGGTAIASLATRHPDGAQGPWAFAIIGGAVAGYHIGKQYDRPRRLIIIKSGAPAGGAGRNP